MQSPKEPPHSIDLAATPGHLIRRAHQIAVAIFAEHLSAIDITPVQFAILNALVDSPGIDQVSLARRVAFDAATSGSVIGRLEAKSWVVREADPVDRRRKLLRVTPEGAQTLASIQSTVALVQERILSPLTTQEQGQFVGMLSRLLQGHEGE
jgi:DNA-binding MarR family transcriptional regulator